MKRKKGLTVGILFLLLGLMSGSGTVQAYERWQTVAESERLGNVDTEANGQITENENVPTLFATKEKEKSKIWAKIDGVCYNGSGKKLKGAITRGIDVSEWQGTIDWKKVKKSDVDFAFIRLAYGKSYVDKKFDYNMKQATAAGVPVGTYVYSLATTTTEAIKEAQVAIEEMKGYKVSYPVVFDAEYSAMGKLSKKKVAQIAKAFCDEVKKAGYYPMIYCNTYWYEDKIDWSVLTGVDVWVAQYGDKILAPSTKDYTYTIWQATDGYGGGVLSSTKGLISGIEIYNNVDINFGYVDYTKKITPRTAALSTYKATSTATVKNGWKTENGKTYYYENGKKVTGWKTINGKQYYFNSTKGYIYKNKMLTSSNGTMYYMDENGVRAYKKWVTVSGKKYYIGSKGYAVKGFQKINGKRYYFDAKKAYMHTNKKIISNKKEIYYVGSNGVCYTNGFHKVKQSGRYYTYYFDKNGKAYTGWHTIKGKKYYFYKGTSAKSGRMAQSVTLTSSKGVVSVFNKNGVCTRQYKKK